MRVGQAVRRFGPVALTLALVVGYWWLRGPEATKIKAGDPAPELSLPSLGTTARTSLSSFRGRPVLLHFFLSHCKLCEQEAEKLERLHRRYYVEGLVVLGVGVDVEQKTVAEFASRHKLTFIVLFDADGAEVRRTFGSRRMPEAYLINAAGVVESVHLGATEWDDTGLRQRLEALLPQPPGGHRH